MIRLSRVYGMVVKAVFMNRYYEIDGRVNFTDSPPPGVA